MRKEQFYLAGKNRVSTMDFKGAIESFEKAVEVNPKSAPAHFELGWLYDQKESDPAAAVYHYERYLKLAPNAGKEEMVKTRILACKQQLAQTVSLGPVTEKQQRELGTACGGENACARNLRSGALTPPACKALPNQAAAVSPTTRTAQSSVSPQPAGKRRCAVELGRLEPILPGPPQRPLRTHVVKAGETPTMIARKYGVKWTR